MASVQETKNETSSPQKLSAELKNDNASCAAEKCDLKQQEKKESRESSDNSKNQRKEDRQEDDVDGASHPAAEKNGEQSSSPLKKESRKKPRDQSPPEDLEKDEDEEDEDGDHEEDEDEDEDEIAGEPDTKRRRTLETNELVAKEKVDLNENGPEEVVEELKNGNSAKN